MKDSRIVGSAVVSFLLAASPAVLFQAEGSAPASIDTTGTTPVLTSPTPRTVTDERQARITRSDPRAASGRRRGARDHHRGGSESGRGHFTRRWDFAVR